MFRQWLNWKTALALVAIVIVTGTIFYSRYLSRKLANEERQKVEQWVEAQRTILFSSDSASLTLASEISRMNDDIPIIETDENNRVTGNYRNLDSTRVATDSGYIRQQLRVFKSLHPPLILTISEKPYIANHYYYGESQLQKEVRYYPMIQLLIVGLFIIITLVALRSSYRSTQNQLWAGMAKETAHQLGTPVSSLEGWIEVLRDIPGNEKLIPELEKDVHRLQLVTDRFGKIGSKPKLEQTDLVRQVENMITYIRKRAGSRVAINLEVKGSQPVTGFVSPPLFDWVIENLLKNALDAMDDKGKIDITIINQAAQVLIDVADNGKGISKAHITKVFNPGFTTKKRGWGLGLTLTKRIIEQYHKGQIYVKSSEPGKGTTFRIVLRKD
ncbi:MAG TPA: HAMP domain-containing sensor histidine kinase [Chitinophagaceae bacterium]